MKLRSVAVVAGAVLFGVVLTLAITRLVQSPAEAPIAPVTIGTHAPATAWNTAAGAGKEAGRSVESRRKRTSPARAAPPGTTPGRTTAREMTPAPAPPRTGTGGSFAPADLRTRRATVDGSTIELSAREFATLEVEGRPQRIATVRGIGYALHS